MKPFILLSLLVMPVVAGVDRPSKAEQEKLDCMGDFVPAGCYKLTEDKYKPFDEVETAITRRDLWAAAYVISRDWRRSDGRIVATGAFEFADIMELERGR